MGAAAGAVNVLRIQRLPLLLLAASSIAIAGLIFVGAYLRLLGIFSRLLFDPGLDALILAAIGLTVLALPALRAREIYLGYSAILTEEEIRVPGVLGDKSIRWSDVVAVEIQEDPKPVIFLWRRQPACRQRLYSLRGAVVVSLQFTGVSTKEALAMMTMRYPALAEKVVRS